MRSLKVEYLIDTESCELFQKGVVRVEKHDEEKDVFFVE